MDADARALRSYEARETLRDGHPLRIRAIRIDDKAMLQEGMHRLSMDSSYYRFFRPKHDLTPQELVEFTEVDFADHVALVALAGDDGEEELAGVGRYIVSAREPAVAAELAFTIVDDYQRRGIGSALLRHLTAVARAAGVDEFRATVLSENRKARELLSHAGLPLRQKREGETIEVRLPLHGAG